MSTSKTMPARPRSRRADSYVYALYARLSQLFADAVHDGLVARNPCSRRTFPGLGRQRPFVVTTEQVWAIYDAVPEGVRPAILLGAYAGLRLAEAAALRIGDVDFMRGVVSVPTARPATSLAATGHRSRARWSPRSPLRSTRIRTALPGSEVT